MRRGVLATLVDTAMGEAPDTLIDAEERPVTVEMKLDHLEPGEEGLLLANAVRRRGHRFTS